jgi:hypothetical protein
MIGDVIIWTEGKTDAQYLARARDALEIARPIDFAQVNKDMGEDQLLKQCKALALTPQLRPTIFIFDRDNNDIVKQVEDPSKNYQTWGNNVFSFAIPIPDHRSDIASLPIELYFTNDDLQKKDPKGRRLYLSSEFNQQSGRHLTNPGLSVGQKGKVASSPKAIRIVDAEVYDEKHNNIALSKADFANCIASETGEFKDINFDNFRKIFSLVENILEREAQEIDPFFAGLDNFLLSLDGMVHSNRLSAVVGAVIDIFKLAAITFSSATIAYYDTEIIKTLQIDAKKIRPLQQLVVENFTTPSLSTIAKLARHCYHLIDERAPLSLQTLKALMAENPLLGPVGALLDDVEKIIPPSRRQGRTVNKPILRKPLLEYLIPEFAKYETKLEEIRASESDALETMDHASWSRALSMLVELLKPLGDLTLRLGVIDRLQSDSDEFIVSLRVYSKGRVSKEEVRRHYSDLSSDRLETYELQISEQQSNRWIELFPFLIIKKNAVLYYWRARVIGYEYRTAFGVSSHVVPTKRKFSHTVFGATIAADRQLLFWTPVVPVVSATGVKANIPAHDPNAFVGRGQQINDVMDEIVQIPNQNGIVFGPGGVGKTALLIELSRKLFEEIVPAQCIFKNIIWISAKRDYYDPTLNLVEKGDQQFRNLDQVWNTILEFHEFEGASEYLEEERRWFVMELLREEKTLLILDNFETIGRTAQRRILRFFGVDMKKYLKDKPDAFKVIITSREVIPSGFHQIGLKGLDKRDANDLMRRLDEPYRQSGQALFTDPQRDKLYEATKGIPLLIKHCYGQMFEYNIPFEAIQSNLHSAGNKVVEFSFSEIFRVLKEDELQKQIIIVLEVMNRPLLVRQIADILNVKETDLAEKVASLASFQCIVRSNSDVDEKYAINADTQMLVKGLLQESMELVIQVKEKIAKLSLEKRMDYTSEEFDAFVVFQGLINGNQLVQAEDFIKERLKGRPTSTLLNLHYAKFLKEFKHQITEAILLLDRIRQTSGNDPHILRLLMMYNLALEVPNFDVAHIYARELEGFGLADTDSSLDIAWFYTEWATSIKMRTEIDPLNEGLRQQRYKELSARAISLLHACSDRSSAKWHYLLAQCQFNKWEYKAARTSINKAILALPKESYLRSPYEKLKFEILKKGEYYERRS